MNLTVLKTEKAAENAVSIYFEKPDEFINYKAGQHGAFSFSIDGEIFQRTYSFHTAPDEPTIGITVRAINNGIVSNFLQRVSPGLSIRLDAIAGEFFLEPSNAVKRHFIMFAGGSGITPIFSMIKSVLVHEPQSSVSLIYSNKNYSRIIFENELRQMESDFAGRLRVHHILTQPDSVPAGFSILYKGRVSPLIIKKILKMIRSEIDGQIEFYLCGPTELMEVVERTVSSIGPVSEIVKKEHFYRGNENNDFDFSSLNDSEIILHAGNEEKLVIVKSGQSILQAVLEQGINLPFSCREGQCGTCRAQLISGEVKLRRNHILTSDELEQGQILLCQGYPLTDNVIVKK